MRGRKINISPVSPGVGEVGFRSSEVSKSGCGAVVNMKLNVAAISALATVASALPHKRDSDQWGHIRSNVSAAACRKR